MFEVQQKSDAGYLTEESNKQNTKETQVVLFNQKINVEHINVSREREGEKQTEKNHVKIGLRRLGLRAASPYDSFFSPTSISLSLSLTVDSIVQDPLSYVPDVYCDCDLVECGSEHTFSVHHR